MAAYHKVEVSLNTNAVEVGIPSPQSVTVTVPTVGPIGPQGPAGPKGDPGEVSGSIAWDNVTDKPSTFTPSSHTHHGDEVYLGEDGDPQPVRLTGFADSGINGNYWPQDITINNKPVYKKNKSYGLFCENDTWHVFDTVPITANILESSDNDSADFPHEAAAWNGVVELANVANFSKDAAQQFVFVGDNISSTQVTGLSIPTASSATPQALGVSAAGTSTDFARADHVHPLPSASDVGAADITHTHNVFADISGALSEDPDAARAELNLGNAATANIGTGAGDVCAGDDARLSDSRTPSSHSSSHASAGSDPLAPSDIGAQSIFATEALGTVTADVTLTAARAKVYTLNTTTSGLRILLPASDVLAGDIVQIRFTSSTGQSITPVRGTMTGFFTSDIGPVGGPVTFIAASASGTSWAVAPVDRHVHGNIGDQGNIGTTSGLPIKTGSGGVLQAGAFGTGAGEFSEGNHTHTQLHDKSHTMTDVTSHTAGNHKVFYSDGSGQIQELALGNSGEVLTSNGATSAPSFAAASGGGATNLWIPASAFIPKTTAGCGVDSRETATNDQNFDELLFDAGSDEFADALVVMPSNYNNGTITARFYWTAASGSGGVAWGIQGRAFANDDALDTAAGTAQLVTDTLIAANDMHVTSATSAVTIGGTPAANTPIQFTIYRDVSDAADDLAVDARLLGVEIIFN